jgi:hypothetical protein
VPKLTQIVAAWAQTWDAQTAPKNAGWNVPPPSKVPKITPTDGALDRLGPAVDWRPRRRSPSSFARCRWATNRGAAREQQIAAVASWATDFASSVVPRPTAGWNDSLVRVPRTITPAGDSKRVDDVFILPPGVTPGSSRGSIVGALTIASGRHRARVEQRGRAERPHHRVAGSSHGSSSADAPSTRSSRRSRDAPRDSEYVACARSCGGALVAPA